MTGNIGRNRLTDLTEENQKNIHPLKHYKNPHKESQISIFSIWFQKFAYHLKFDKFCFD